MMMKVLRLLSGVMIVFCLTACISEPFNKEEAAKARLRLAIAYLAEGNLQAAYTNLDKALEYTPDDYQVQLGMAMYEQAIGKEDNALKRYLSLLNGDMKDNSVVLNHYGVFLCVLNEYESAQQQFVKAMQTSDYAVQQMVQQNMAHCLDQQRK